MAFTDLTRFRRDLHRIPEPGFQEVKTQQYLLDVIRTLPQEHLSYKTWETGILVRIEGSDPEKTVGYRTDMDGLPVPEQSGLEFPSGHEGMMHACGHDMHMAIALGILQNLSEHRPVQNVVMLFQPAEEGPGGAEPMIRSEEFKAWKPDEIYALHIAPEHPVGTIATKPGVLFANTSELFINLRGKGGHAARPHQTEDMVVAASHFVTQLQSIVARNIDPLDPAVVTIGTIEAGTKQNIIAESARVEGTIRTFSMDNMKLIKERITGMLKGTEASFHCETDVDWGANYCQVYNDEAKTAELTAFAESHGQVNFVESREAMTGEDFGYFLRDIPGTMVWLGVDTPYGLHDNRISPSEKAMDTAVEFFTDFLCSR